MADGELKHLGQQSQEPTEELDGIVWEGGTITVTLECTEFTSLCPVTRQPDFGKLVITYRPDKRIVETKSLKLWLWRFRNRMAFNEALVDEIAEDFFRQVGPHVVTVHGVFNTRGGISVAVEANRSKIGQFLTVPWTPSAEGC